MSQNTAASYTRVSSDSQQSVMAQLERIRRFAEEHGLEVAREFEDERHSRATDSRPGFQRMIAAACRPKSPSTPSLSTTFQGFPGTPQISPGTGTSWTRQGSGC